MFALEEFWPVGLEFDIFFCSTAPLRHVTSAQTTQVAKLNRGTTARSTFHSGQTRERKKMAEERNREAGSPVASGRTSFISKLTSRFSKRYEFCFIYSRMKHVLFHEFLSLHSCI